MDLLQGFFKIFQNERVREVYQKYITLTRLIFAEINFRVDLFSQMPQSIFLRGHIFADGQILVILRGLIFVFDKNLYLKQLLYLICL